MSNSSERRPLRVLWLAKGLGPGGMEGLLVTHARLGDRDAFSYRAAYVVERPNSVVPRLEALGVPCTPLGGGRFGPLSWAARLRQLVREHGIDVVHTHSPSVAAIARVALRTLRHRPRLVYTEHNSWYSYALPTRILNAATYPLDDDQFSVSAAAVESMPAPFRRRITVLTHGIDLDAVRAAGSERDAVRAELEIADDELMLLTVANLRTEKAYDVLLDAAAMLADSTPPLRFVSVGQGPLADELESRRRALGLGGRFRFLGFRDDVPRLLAGADLFVLSSRSEGLPLGLMEAFAAGVAPVVTAVGGMPDHVLDGRTGRLVEPGSPEALAAAIRSVATDPDLRRRLAEGAAGAATAFDAAAPVAVLEAAYRRGRP